MLLIRILKDILNHQKKLIEQDKSFFNKNQTEFLELSHYNKAINQHLFWQDRFEVDLLLRTFLNKKIDRYEFDDTIFSFRHNYIAKYNKFILKLGSDEINEFFPNKESYKLKKFLSALYCEWKYFELNWDEEILYNFVQSAFLKFQQILNDN